MFRFILALALALPLVAQADPDRQRSQARDAQHSRDGQQQRAAGTHDRHKRRRVVVDQRRLQRRLDAIDTEMSALEALLAQQPDGFTRGHRRESEHGSDYRGRRGHRDKSARRAAARHKRAVAAQLEVVRARIKSMHRAVAKARPAPRVRRRPAAPQAMSKSQLKRLVRALDDAPFRDDKRAVLRRAVSQAYFTSAQARAVAREFPFSDDKVAALTAMHPRVVDPENFEQVFSDLNFSSARRKLDQNIYASNGHSRRR